jgi:hypothetical protein
VRVAASEPAAQHFAQRAVMVMEMMAISVARAAAVFSTGLFLNRKILADADIEFGHAVLPFYAGEIGTAPSYVNQIIINI